MQQLRFCLFFIFQLKSTLIFFLRKSHPSSDKIFNINCLFSYISFSDSGIWDYCSLGKSISSFVFTRLAVLDSTLLARLSKKSWSYISVNFVFYKFNSLFHFNFIIKWILQSCPINFSCHTSYFSKFKFDCCIISIQHLKG